MHRFFSSKYFVLFAALMVIAFFLVCASFFIYDILLENRERNLQQMSDSTSQKQAALYQRIDSNLQMLHGAASCLLTLDLEGREETNSLIAGINDSNDFLRMGLSNLEGKVDLMDIDGSVYRDVDISGSEFFTRARSGGNGVSATRTSYVNDEDVNCYAVPLKRGGEVESVLCAVDSSDVMNRILSAPVFNGQGDFAVVDSHGKVVMGGNGEIMSTLGANILKTGSFGEDELDSFKLALALGDKGIFHLTHDSEDHVIATYPLGVNNWSVISVIECAALNVNYGSAIRDALILIAAACVIFAFLMYHHARTLAKNQKELLRLAYQDPLTGCRNFPKFQLDARDILDKNHNALYAIWSFDTKHFGGINEIFGNDTGDMVLKETAEVFERNGVEGSLFCRVSSDVFAGLMPYTDKNELVDWFWRIRDESINREVIADNKIKIGDAIGFYCISDFDEKLTISDMANRASTARRIAKAQAGSAFAFYTKAMGEKQRFMTAIEAGGMAAIQNGDISIFLQPKVSIKGGYRIVGAEVLARWNHKDYGFIPPSEFIPLFEHGGFIAELDRYIFNEALKWRRGCRGCAKDMRLAINVSRQGLLREDFLEYYTNVKKKYGIADGVIELEFTESVAVDDNEVFRDMVQKLKQAGFVCSIDDFGSGYSSLNVLKNLPIDVLKLDAAFFRGGGSGEREHIVVGNFIKMAKELGIRTVAEGVEMVDQVRFLELVGCDIIQGYIFSKPLPVWEFENLMSCTGGEFTGF